MNLEDILEEGVLYSFYGVDGNYFKIGSIVFEAVEDENDGYRSMLEAVPVVYNKGIFPAFPIINLYYSFLDEDEGLHIFRDEKGHQWLEIGTDFSDDYYPLFIFRYTPRTDVTEYSEPIHNLDDLDPQHLHAEKLI